MHRFCGLWLAPLGYLAYKLLAAFLVPDFGKQIHPFVVVVPAVAEIWMGVYLLAKGVKSPRRTDRAPVAGLAPVAA